MKLTILELITINRLIDQKIELYESFLENDSLHNFFQNQIDDLITIKSKINERIETILC